jgi:outer membrane lipoprotein-sorting protein
MIARRLRPRAIASLLFLAVGTLAFAAEPPIIAKARARIAPDAVLDAVNSIHYVGTLVGPDAADPTKQQTQSIEIFLQKPARQRIVVSSPLVIEVSALDGYDAWRRTIDAKNPSRWQQSQLGADQVKQLRADVWQNLAFYRGLERVGGHVEDLGPVTIDGVPCERVAFLHSATLVYYRYFSQATGELVFTGTAENNTRERGEMIVGGIRFPKAIVVAQMLGGKSVQRTITFDKITVNEKMPDDLFVVPLPSTVIK